MKNITNTAFYISDAACCGSLCSLFVKAVAFLGNKKWLACLGLLFLLFYNNIISAQQGSEFAWVRIYGNEAITSRTNVNVANDRRLAIDDWQNAYVAGSFTKEADFNLLYNPVLLTPKNSSGNVFITKHNAAGELIWAKQYFSTDEGGSAWCEGIISDRSGDIYITGEFTGTIKFQIGQSSDSMTSTYGTRSYTRDVFIAKLDSAGNCLWAKGFGGKAEDYAYSLEGDNNGHVYLTGIFQDTVDFDPGAGITRLVSSRNRAQTAFVANSFIAKFDSNGNHIWAKHLYGATAQSNTNSIAVDKAGAAYITGKFSDTLFFQTGSGQEYIVSSAGTIFFIAKIDSSGAFQWVKGTGTGGARFTQGIGVDDSGNVFYTGRFRGTADFSTDASGLMLSSSGEEDAFVSKLNSKGDLLWVKTFGSGGGDGAFSLDVDRVGGVYITGGFNGTVDFDPGPGIFNLTATQNITNTDLLDDVFFLKLHGNGDFAWARAINGSYGETEVGRNIRLDRSGNIYVAGSFWLTSGDRVDFNPGMTDSDTFFVTKMGEAFLLKLGCTDTSSFSLDVTESSNSYTYDGETYTKSGQYIHKFLNAIGCDSTVILNLLLCKIEKPVINVDVFTLGVTRSYTLYQWIKNDEVIPGATGATFTVTDNGNYQVIVTDENGCIDTSDVYVVDNVGVEDILFRNTLQLYPNPTSGYITFTSAEHLQNSTIRLVNLLGQTVKIYRNMQGNRFSFDLSSYADGIYFIEVTESDRKARMKIVKVK